MTEDTIKQLSEMTDDAEFERLAMAILREANPEYASLLHTGVNSAGKTVKSPVDGISFAIGAQPPHMLAVHHTTCARKDLEGKWLHDPATVKPHKGGKPKAPPGDVLKAAKLYEDERARLGTLRGTLILTTNQEPSEELVRDTHATGRKFGLSVDIWSASRLAHVLDNTPTGQWIRAKYLRIDQERLSKELLAKLSRDSLDAHRPSNDIAAWVPRSLDGLLDAADSQDVVFVIAESGLGKSVACYKYLDRHIASGGFGLILPHHLLASTLTVNQAVEAALEQLHPALAPGSGNTALSFCSGDRPFIVVVEDINKSGQAQYLAEKLTQWAAANSTVTKETGQGTTNNNWRLICPVWPQVVSSLKDEARKRVQGSAIVGAAFTPPEGREAIQRRAKARGIYISDMEADSISNALGHDPLLIALQEPGRQPDSTKVIEDFIDGSASRLAGEKGEFTAGDYRASLRLLAAEALHHRELNPKWQSVIAWFAQQGDALTMLRHLVHHGEVIRITGAGVEERLTFRHDRVRDTLFADALGGMIKDDTISPLLLSEPYFSEVLGAALLIDGIPVPFIDQVTTKNPLALFHALRIFREPATPIHDAIIAAISQWLAEPATHRQENEGLRWAALAALSETESSKVIGIVRQFKDRAWTAWQALFRNGDVTGGLNLCLDVEPGTGAVWRDRQIEHAKSRFGSNLRKSIGELLRRPDLGRPARVGALRLAGFLAAPQLAEPIEASWANDAQKDDNLADYLWAAGRCCGNESERFLTPVCDAWAALSDEGSEHRSSPRQDLAAHNIRWAFIENIPISAIGFFIKRAAKDDLRWPITYMLHGIDHPDAVEFVVREIAERERPIEGKGLILPFGMTASDEWRRRQEGRGKPMSRESRERLLSLWQNGLNDKFVRQKAFSFWTVTRGTEDLEILRAVKPNDLLADSALWGRLVRKDHTAIPALLDKLNGEERAQWWHLGEQIWSDELAKAFDEELTRRGAVTPREWGATYPSDYTLAEIIVGLPVEEAERLLLKHWDHLRYYNYYVQAALYAATPRLLKLVREVVKSTDEQHKVFEHISMHYGVQTHGRVGVTRREQFEALAPYLDMLDEHDICTFWQVCNDRGWYDLRTKYFDARINKKYGHIYIDEEGVLAALDRRIEHPYWIDHEIEHLQKAGMSLTDVMAIIRKWLESKKSLPALKVAALAVEHAGQRHDLKVLDVAVEPKEAADAIRFNASFAVHRRTLR
ncbi:hypothetical protein [Rhodopseudomonas parapalustris]